MMGACATCEHKRVQAFWVDFGDFSFMQLRDVAAVGYIGGFGRISKVRQSAAAAPDTATI